MNKFPVSFSAFIGSLWFHRTLIKVLVMREVAGRYRGSFLGLLWSFINPVLMLAVYTFVFSVVFKARWGGGGDDRFEFALVLFAGLLIFNLFAECISRAPGLVVGNVNYVKKIIFPLEILPWVAMGSALFHAMISLLVLLSALALTRGLSWSILLLPLVMLPFLILIIGFSWILASIGVFIRDVGQFIGMVITVMMFMSPIFYPISALPPGIGRWLLLNPLTFIVEQARAVIIWGHLPDFSGLALYGIISVCLAWAGFFWFQKTRKGFADVL